jgi:hypothetical protein
LYEEAVNPESAKDFVRYHCLHRDRARGNAGQFEHDLLPCFVPTGHLDLNGLLIIAGQNPFRPALCPLRKKLQRGQVTPTGPIQLLPNRHAKRAGRHFWESTPGAGEIEECSCMIARYSL